MGLWIAIITFAFDNFTAIYDNLTNERTQAANQRKNKAFGHLQPFCRAYARVPTRRQI